MVFCGRKMVEAVDNHHLCPRFCALPGWPAVRGPALWLLATVLHTSSLDNTMVVRYQSRDGRDRQTLPFRIFVGRIVHSKTLDNLEILPRGVLGVRSDGTIAFVRSFDHPEDDTYKTEDGFENAETIHLEPSQFLMPGMIDTHLHAPQWPNLALGMEGQLKEWVEDWTNPIEVFQCSRKDTAATTDLTRGVLQRQRQSLSGVLGCCQNYA